MGQRAPQIPKDSFGTWANWLHVQTTYSGLRIRTLFCRLVQFSPARGNRGNTLEPPLGRLFFFFEIPKKLREGLYCLIHSVQVFSREGHLI